MPTITNSPSNSSEVSQILRDTHFQLVSIINEAEQAHCEEACNEEEISQCAQDFLQQTQEEETNMPKAHRAYKSKSEGSINRKRKVKVLFPVQEEDLSVSSVDKESYKKIFKQCHSDLKTMKIGVNSGRGFIALPKLKDLIEDIEAIKTGNYIAVDN